MPAPATSIVLGLGNTLHSDDGIGPQAIERLRSDPRVPADVSLIEGGTLGLELLTYIWDCSYLLVLDAVDVGQPPGTLVRMSGQELQTLPGKSNSRGSVAGYAASKHGMGHRFVASGCGCPAGVRRCCSRRAVPQTTYTRANNNLEPSHLPGPKPTCDRS